ncbi:MAG: hypothetical protein WCT99_08230 [Bacteroidota bacterium]|jgi:hypothetical protein
MKWNIVFLLSLFGIGMGIASLFGLTEKIEIYEWILIALLSAYFLSKQTTHKVFLHGVYSGIAMGILFAVIQISFFGMYLENNPSALPAFRLAIGDFNPQLFVLLLSPVVGGVYGLVIGGLSVAAGKFHIPK